MQKSNTTKKQHIAVSAGLNIIRRACMIAFPLITYAYATRVLGTEGIGIYEFSQSIVSYFALIAALGISQYAVRDGAAYLKDENQMSQFASEVFAINFFMTLVSYGIMTILVLFNPLLNSYKSAIFIYSISILFTTLGVDWINSLYEDYLYLTIRYIIVSMISLGLLFIFVRKPEDLNKYVAISIFAIVVNGLLNYIYIQKYVRVRLTFNLNIAKHGLPIFILFCNNIASVIYLNSDVTILRILTDDNQVGLYGVAAKIYSMIKELMNAAIFVTIPRFSSFVSESQNQVSNDDRYIKGLKGLLSPLATVLVPSCVGLAFLSREVIRIVAGDEFFDGAIALSILAIAMFFAVTACFLAYAIIMPYKLEKFFLIATSIAAGINIILNFIMIPMIGMKAAAITTLIAEIMVFSMLAFIASKRVSFKEIINMRDFVAIIMGSVAVVIVCLIKGILFSGETTSIIGTIITVIVAVIVYSLLQVIMGNSIKDYIKSIRKKN